MKSFSFSLRSLGKALLIGLSATGSCLAAAQESFDAHVADMVILMAKSVQKDIGITDSQRSQLNSYAEKFNAQQESYRLQVIKSKSKPDMKKIVDAQIAFKNLIFSKLTAAQLKRLREISLQHDGVSALADDIVAKRIGLSAAQLKKIRDVILRDRNNMQALEQKAAKPILDKYKNLKPKNEAEANSLKEKASKEMQAAARKFAPQIQKMVIDDQASIKSTLDSKQKSTWDSLLGKPFSGK